MAIDYSGFARNVGNQGVDIGSALSRIASKMPTPEERLMSSVENHIMNISLQPLMDLYTSDVDKWKKDLGSVPNAFEAYNAWKSELSHSDKLKAQRAGINPISFKALYDNNLNSITKGLGDKLLIYKGSKNLSPKSLRSKLKDMPILRTYLSNSPLTSPEIAGDLMQPSGAFSQLKGLGKMFTPDLEEEGLIKSGLKTVATPYGGGKTAGQLVEKAAEMFGAKEKGQRLSKEAGELAGTIGAGIATQRYLPSILAKIQQIGLPEAIKKIAKKKGTSFVAKTLGKLGVGALGGAATGGALTAAMAAWSAKDLYDIGKILLEDDKK